MRTAANTALLVLLGAAGCASAAPIPQSSDDLDVDDSRSRERAREVVPFMWRVEGPTPSYLFGTIHIGVNGTEVPSSVWAALDASRTIILEADLDSVDPDELARRGQLANGRNLESLIGAAAWQRAQALLGPASEYIREVEPWLAQSRLLFALFPTDVPIDVAVLKRAQSLDKRLAFLETTAEQLDVMETETGPEQLRALLDPESASRRHLHQLIDAYHSGDVNMLEAVALDADEIRADPAHYERLFFSRNRRWADSLSPALAQGGLFVTVGVGHLLGKKGLPALLRERGFTVTQSVVDTVAH